MNTLQQELDDVLKLKKSGGGFHYIYQAMQLADKTHRARRWYNLLKTPISKWKQTLAETRLILDELDKSGIHAKSK